MSMRLCPVYESQNMEVFAVEGELVWANISMAVDSGACAHVTPNEGFAIGTVPSELSKSQSTFFGANGSPIPILGNRFVKTNSDNGDDIC